jgi:hypothetical protein
LVRKCLWTAVTNEVFACSSTQYTFSYIDAAILKSAPLVSISEMSSVSVLPNETWRVSLSCYICIGGINSLQHSELCFLFVPFILNYPVYHVIWDHLNSVLHISLPSVILTLEPPKLYCFIGFIIKCSFDILYQILKLQWKESRRLILSRTSCCYLK